MYWQRWISDRIGRPARTGLPGASVLTAVGQSAGALYGWLANLPGLLSRSENAKWLLQLGFSYDTSPVDSDDRTPDMPIDRQIRYATGAQYQWSERLSTGAQFVYADYGNAKIDNDLLKGEYKNNDLFFFSINANWKF